MTPRSPADAWAAIVAAGMGRVIVWATEGVMSKSLPFLIDLFLERAIELRHTG